MTAESTNRDFSNYITGDDVRTLGDGVLYEVADSLHVDISGVDPDPATLRRLVGALGPKPELRENRDLNDIWTPEQAAKLVDRSGVQTALDRGLWTPEQTPTNATLVLTGAVANWQDRAANVLLSRNPDGPVIVATGDREMKTKSEATNPHVLNYVEAEGLYPTESIYAAHFILPSLQEAGYDTRHLQLVGVNGDQVATAVAQEFTEVFNDTVAAVRVANAGLQLACQLRKAAKAANMYVITDGFEVATTQEQIDDPANYQNPYTALRQVALTGKLLFEASRA